MEDKNKCSLHPECNNNMIPVENSVKYLGVRLDERRTWVIHVKTKRKSHELKLYQLRQLLR